MEIAKTLNKNSERNMGIELLRIVAMFMIVVHHLLFHGGILDNVCPNTANYYIANILEVICLVCVNLFCLISGYVCLYTKHRYSRIINLWIEVFICSTAIALGIKLFTNYSLSFASLIFSFFPIISNSYWYFTCYFCLFFFMPLLNRAILSTGKNELKLILFIGFITLSFFDFISKINGTLDLGIENGFSLIWFIYLYLCGGYIRKYALDFSTKKYIYLIKYLGFTALSLLFYIANNYLSEYYFNSLGGLGVCSYNAPFMVLASICFL
ncbi:MAG: acyltransferase family protein [Ruminococcus sp.]|nr:acyltransferase family protein [Ruminococcus sp.]